MSRLFCCISVVLLILFTTSPILADQCWVRGSVSVIRTTEGSCTSWATHADAATLRVTFADGAGTEDLVTSGSGPCSPGNYLCHPAFTGKVTGAWSSQLGRYIQWGEIWSHSGTLSFR